MQLVQRPMRARIEYLIREGMAAGWPAERITLAVFAALREPTEAMEQADSVVYNRKPDFPFLYISPREMWQAMIDIALADGQAAT
jgi:hypothetical protein